MAVSKCCKEAVFVVSCDEGTAYYACNGCHMACDTVVLTQGKETENGAVLDVSGLRSQE